MTQTDALFGEMTTDPPSRPRAAEREQTMTTRWNVKWYDTKGGVSHATRAARYGWYGPYDFVRFQREPENHRYLYTGRVLIGWATLVKGEPFEGPWFGIKAANGYIRFGTRWGCVAIGVA